MKISKEYYRQWYQAHAAQRRAESAEYYRRNKEKILEGLRDRLKNDKPYAERLGKRRAKLHIKHRERFNRKSREWQANHKD